MSNAKMITKKRPSDSQSFPLPANGCRGSGAGSPEGRRRRLVRLPTPLVRSEPMWLVGRSFPGAAIC